CRAIWPLGGTDTGSIGKLVIDHSAFMGASTIEDTVIGWLTLLCRIRFLVTPPMPIWTLPNTSGLGSALRPRLVPVPTSGTVTGDFGSLLVSTTLPLDGPICVGWNTTWNVPGPPGGTVAGSWGKFCTANGPVTVPAVMTSGALPVFWTVNVCGSEV